MKKKLGALVIVNSIFVIAFVAVMIMLGVLYPIIGNFIDSMNVFFSNGFFAFSEIPQILTMSVDRMVAEIISLVFVLAFVVLATILIIVCTKRKKPLMILFLIMILVDFAIAFFSLVNLIDIYWPFVIQVANIASMSLSIVALVTAVVNLLLGIILFSLVIKTTKNVVPENIVRIATDNLDKPETIAQDHLSEQVVNKNVETSEVPEPEPIPVFMPEPEPEQVIEKDVDGKATIQGIDPNMLVSMIRDVVRDVVRDELARAELNKNASQPVQNLNPNPTSPIVVQYFSGDHPNSGTDVTPKVAHVEAVAQKDKKQIGIIKNISNNGKKIVPAKTITVKPEEVAEEKVYERISFIDRMIGAEKDMKANYNELKNEAMAYGVHSRVSNSGDTFRLHRKTYFKLTIAGKSLKLYFALNPKDYKNTTIPVQDASAKGIYKEIPLVFKVKSDLSMRRAKQLIQTVMEKDNRKQGEIAKKDWIKELKSAIK